MLPQQGLCPSTAGCPAAIPERRVGPSFQQQAHSLSLPRTRGHVKQGEAVLVQGLVEQGARQIQVLCILPVLAFLQGAPVLWHAKEVL